MGSFLGMPAEASAHAAGVDHLIILLHWVCFLLFVGWILYFFYAIFRFRASKNPRADYHGSKSRFSSYVEGGVALAEAILLVGFSMPLWAERVNDFPSEKDAVVARVVGEQFAWNVHYPGPDGVFGKTDINLVDLQTNPLGVDRSDPYAKDDITTVNQLHLPVDRPALIYLRSKDVIHSFNLVEMRVKQDAVPGLTIPVWFTPTVTTAQMRVTKKNPQYNYEIACAQLCGLGHYSMRGFMTIDTQDEFEQWIQEQSAAQQSSGGDSFWKQ